MRKVFRKALWFLGHFSGKGRLEHDRVVIRIPEALIERLQRTDFDVPGDDEAVDHVVLESLFVGALVRLVQTPAGRDLLFQQFCSQYSTKDPPAAGRIVLSLFTRCSRGGTL